MGKTDSSFKQQVKKELCELKDEARGCMRAELSGLLTPNVQLRLNESGTPEKLSLHTDAKCVAGKIYHLCKNLYDVTPIVQEEKMALSRSGVVYGVSFTGEKLPEMLKDLRIMKKREGLVVYDATGIPPLFLDKPRFLKAYIRGIFLACGSVSDPEKDYYLELVNGSELFLLDLQETLASFNIHLHLTTRRKRHVLYAKEAESVVLFLQLIGANKALFGVENFRALKEVRNHTNRLVNCEISNINKTTDAAVKQLAVIKRIQNTIGLEMLPDGLKDLAILRLENPEASIRELGEMMDPPLGKSGVYKRFEKMEKMSLIE